MTKVLITGISGFCGSHIAQHIFANTDWDVIGLDRLSYAGRLDRIAHLKGPRLKMVFHDFRAEFPSSVLRSIERADFIIHNGAETHVDRSLKCPEVFLQSNVTGTMNVLEAARKVRCKRLIYTSTDEVFGPAPEGTAFKESDELRPSNPYSAAKAAGEMLCHAYHTSFGVPAVITRTMNMFGEMQHPEKFVPLVMRKILRGEPVTIHAGPDGRMGSRCWLHARNQADAILFLLRYEDVDEWPVKASIDGSVWHIAGKEYTNYEIAERIFWAMPVEAWKSETVDAVSHRRGHDLRYALDGSKILSLGWNPPVEFEESLQRTVAWTMEHREWLED